MKRAGTSPKLLQLSREIPTVPSQHRDKMAQINVDAFHCEGIIFVVDMEDLFSRKARVQLSDIGYGLRKLAKIRTHGNTS